ncbi:MAG: glycoside hydrolase family 2 protein [Fimbriimonas sp.]
MESPIRCVLALVVTLASTVAFAGPQADRGLRTPWAAKVDRLKPLDVYPRPQLVRSTWVNLNGAWDYLIVAKGEKPRTPDGKILVPFAIESALSGVRKEVGPAKELWYSRLIALVPEKGKRWILNFGAVDWEAEVFVNGRSLALHRGGYAPFSVDVTDALRASGENQLQVRVWDPTGDNQPRGKQLSKPEGIWYTSVTGIWQTVWAEAVPEEHITGVQFQANLDRSAVSLKIEGGAPQSEISIFDGKKLVAKAKFQKEAWIKIPRPKLWSPDSPFLYTAKIRSGQDDVQTYFAMREVGTGRDESGTLRLMLNKKPIFHFGPLDQGWWPDGLYTAPTDEALKSDIVFTRKLGFNMARKHVKVEPARWYYWADKLGLMVWQDMPSTFMPGSAPEADKQQFQTEWKEIMDSVRFFPSVVLWVVFNEGWGQHDTERLTAWTKAYDPSRTVSNASGWTDMGVGDVLDMHHYPDPASPPAQPKRVAVLGEYGGLGLPIEGHTWVAKGNWGYRSFTTIPDLRQAFREQLPSLLALRNQHLSAAVYTQTTDVEVEVNGLMTYDRKVIKVDASVRPLVEAVIKGTSTPALRQLTKIFDTIVRNARTAKVIWKSTLTEPGFGWEKPDFDDSQWTSSFGGFGTPQTPGAIVGTEWSTPSIWLRREFDLGIPVKDLILEIHHDEDAEVWVNGVLIADLKGYTSDYARVPIPAAKASAFRKGRNVLAIRCKQTSGGQFIDAGFVIQRRN